MTRPLRKEHGRLDPARPAVELERQVRAYRPWPGSWIGTLTGRIVVERASVDRQPSSASEPVVAGTLTVDGEGELVLVTGQGRSILDEVRPAGGRPMRGPDLVRGRPQLPGSRVRS